MKAPANTTAILKKEAERLFERLFRGKWCIVHYKKSGKIKTWRVEKHHLIKRSGSVRFKYEIWNILPLCENCHQWAHDSESEFMEWFKNELPLHWAWYEEHRYDAAHTLREGDWQEICDDLRYYLSHPWEADRIIYEKGF